jgi:hypothetical protein
MHMVNTCVIADDTTIGASINENRAIAVMGTHRIVGDVRWVYTLVVYAVVVTEGTTLMVCSGAL